MKKKNYICYFLESPQATVENNTTNVAATSDQSEALKVLQECPIELQSIYQTKAKKFEGKIPMKKRKPTQTTTLLQPLQTLTPIIYPSSLSKIPSSTEIQMISQPSVRKPIIIPEKMEVTIQPKLFPIVQTAQTAAGPSIVIVKSEKIIKTGDTEDEEDDLTHFEEIVPNFEISSINNSSLQLSSTTHLLPATLKICNSSSSLGVNHTEGSTNTSTISSSSTTTATSPSSAAAAAGESSSAAATKSSSLPATTNTITGSGKSDI